MSNSIKAWFVRFRSEASDPFYPFAMDCYVGGQHEKDARENAIAYAAKTSEFREAFENPVAVAGERLIDVERCPDMDDVISFDPDADRQLAKAKGLWGLKITIDADGPQLEWKSYASVAEARMAERDFIEHLFDNIPKRVFSLALEDPWAKI